MRVASEILDTLHISDTSNLGSLHPSKELKPIMRIIYIPGSAVKIYMKSNEKKRKSGSLAVWTARWEITGHRC